LSIEQRSFRELNIKTQTADAVSRRVLRRCNNFPNREFLSCITNVPEGRKKLAGQQLTV
jgi:hypothetical protein